MSFYPWQKRIKTYCHFQSLLSHLHHHNISTPVLNPENIRSPLFIGYTPKCTFGKLFWIIHPVFLYFQSYLYGFSDFYTCLCTSGRNKGTFLSYNPYSARILHICHYHYIRTGSRHTFSRSFTSCRNTLLFVACCPVYQSTHKISYFPAY